MNERVDDPLLEAAVMSFLDMLRKQYGDDPDVWREILSSMKQANEAAKEAGNFDVLSLCLSCDDVMGRERQAQKAPSPCRAAQEKVRQEAERIKNDYTKDVKRRGRSLNPFSNPPPTELGAYRLMPSQYLEINQSISKAYAQLARDAPDLPWVPVGHVVAAQFGCNMGTMSKSANAAESRPFGGNLANQLDDAIRAIGEGCIRIFDNLYPTMRLVADLGVEQFLKCVENKQFQPPPPPQLIKAVEEMKKGNFDRAEYLIVDYEQRDVAPDIYRDFEPQYRFMQDLAEMTKRSTFGYIDPQSVLPIPQCAFMPGFSLNGIDPVPMDGSLFNEDDRIDFYKKLKNPVLQHYRR